MNIIALYCVKYNIFYRIKVIAFLLSAVLLDSIDIYNKAWYYTQELKKNRLFIEGLLVLCLYDMDMKSPSFLQYFSGGYDNDA